MAAERLLIRLYLDADVDAKLAVNLKAQGYDCVSARHIGNDLLDDEEWNAGRPHSGIVVSDQIPLGELQRRVLRLLDTVTADEMVNNLRHLAEFAERSC